MKATANKYSYQRFSRSHTYGVSRRKRTRHDVNGDALNGMDLFISKNYRDLCL